MTAPITQQTNETMTAPVGQKSMAAHESSFCYAIGIHIRDATGANNPEVKM